MYKLERYLGTAPKKLRRALESNEPIRPLSVKIKLTWHCNLACVMCSEWRIQGKAPPRPNYFDSWAKLQRVLEDLIALKTKKVHFSGGEPLMHPSLEQAIRYLTERGRHVSLVSNGTLWTPARSQALMAAGLSQVTFSIDSPVAETFAKMRGRAAWTQLQQGIQAARAAADASGRQVLLKANTVLTRDNFREMVHYPALAAQWGIDRIRFLPVDDLHTESQPRLRLTAAEIEEYNAVIAPMVLESGLAYGVLAAPADAYPFGRTPAEVAASEQGWYARGFYEDNHCFAPWLHSLIAADGRIYGCCMLKGEKIAIDQLGQQGFQAIWEGSRYQAFRAQMLAAKYAICAHCDDYLPENRYLNMLLRATPVPPGVGDSRAKLYGVSW